MSSFFEAFQEFFEVKFEVQCLRTHNFYRRKHGCPPLKLNPAICLEAERWAQECSVEGFLMYCSECDYAQNMFKTKDLYISGGIPVDRWYATNRYYYFNEPRITLFNKKFIQLLWKNSKELGIGAATNNGVLYVIAFYYPAGNENIIDEKDLEVNVPQEIRHWYQNVYVKETFKFLMIFVG